MKAVIRLFLVLLTLTTIVYAWLTHQLSSQQVQLILVILVLFTLAAFFLMNLLDHKEERKRRLERESRDREGAGEEARKIKRSDQSFSLKERKSGLTWGGGNIKASEATRGTKRKFLGR